MANCMRVCCRKFNMCLIDRRAKSNDLLNIWLQKDQNMKSFRMSTIKTHAWWTYSKICVHCQSEQQRQQQSRQTINDWIKKITNHSNTDWNWWESIHSLRARHCSSPASLFSRPINNGFAIMMTQPDANTPIHVRMDFVCRSIHMLVIPL